MFIKVVERYSDEIITINPDHIIYLTYDSNGEYTCIFTGEDTPLVVRETPRDIVDKVLAQEFLMAKYLEFVGQSSFDIEKVTGHLMANSVGGVSE